MKNNSEPNTNPRTNQNIRATHTHRKTMQTAKTNKTQITKANVKVNSKSNIIAKNTATNKTKSKAKSKVTSTAKSNHQSKRKAKNRKMPATGGTNLPMQQVGELKILTPIARPFIKYSKNSRESRIRGEKAERKPSQRPQTPPEGSLKICLKTQRWTNKLCLGPPQPLKIGLKYPGRSHSQQTVDPRTMKSGPWEYM